MPSGTGHTESEQCGRRDGKVFAETLRGGQEEELGGLGALAEARRAMEAASYCRHLK